MEANVTGESTYYLLTPNYSFIITGGLGKDVVDVTNARTTVIKNQNTRHIIKTIIIITIMITMFQYITTIPIGLGPAMAGHLHPTEDTILSNLVLKLRQSPLL